MFLRLSAVRRFRRIRITIPIFAFAAPRAVVSWCIYGVDIIKRSSLSVVIFSSYIHSLGVRLGLNHKVPQP